jgi:PAS domain S-box-containing protein
MGKPMKSTADTVPERMVTGDNHLEEVCALLDFGAFMVRDLNGRISLWSKGCERLFGWTADEAVGRIADRLLKVVFPVPRAEIAAALGRERQWIGELRMTGRDGSELIVAVHKVLRQAEPERSLAVIETFVDVTAQRRAELALLESEARFRTYFDNSADCLFHVRPGPDGRLVYEAVNPAGLAHAGVTAEQARGRTPDEVLGPHVGGEIAAGLRQVFETGQPYRFQPIFDIGTGAITYDAIFLPLCDQNGKVTGVLGDARDISEHRRVESLLRQSQKMDALGHLAGGVAHDFNNVLGGLLGSLELLEDEVGTERGKALLASCVRSIDRGKSLIKRLLAYARQQPMVSIDLDINALIVDVVDLLDRTLGNGVALEKNLSPSLWPSQVDRNQLELAILNLAINSRDALPDGGRVIIETRNETIATAQPDALPPGDYVTITVIDNGTGMTPDVLMRAMDPFFTTKTPDKGSGLGLSTVYGLTRQLGGGMRIASAPGQGTRVTLFLPRAPAAQAG